MTEHLAVALGFVVLALVAFEALDLDVPALPRRCRHLRRRCVHGDEIIALRFRRAVCLRCGRALRELPATCSYSGRRH